MIKLTSGQKSPEGGAFFLRLNRIAFCTSTMKCVDFAPCRFDFAKGPDCSDARNFYAGEWQARYSSEQAATLLL